MLILADASIYRPGARTGGCKCPDLGQPANPTNVMETVAMAEASCFVSGISSRFQSYVDTEPELLSLLYDLDLLPEQLLHVLQVNPSAAVANASRMVAVCELWKARDPQKWAVVRGKP